MITALKGGEWTIDEIGGILETLFEKQYILTETVTTETRYRTETHIGYYTDENGKQHDEKTRATTRFVQDNNELTFSSLSLYYEFNPRLISKIRLKRLKLAFYMNNIATLSSIRIERGTTYPFARSMSLQLTGTF